MSAGEQALLQQAGAVPAPAPGIRSEAGSPDTQTVNKGSATRDILNAPATTGTEAKAATTPQ